MNDLSAEARALVKDADSYGVNAKHPISIKVRQVLEQMADEIDTLTKRVEELERIDVIAREAVRQLAGWEARAKSAEARLAEIESLSLSGMETTREERDELRSWAECNIDYSSPRVLAVLRDFSHLTAELEEARKVMEPFADLHAMLERNGYYEENRPWPAPITLLPPASTGFEVIGRQNGFIIGHLGIGQTALRSTADFLSRHKGERT